MTLDEGRALLLAQLRLAGYSPATIHNYSSGLRRFGDWLRQRGITDLRAVTAAQLRAYAMHLRRQPMGLGSQALRLGVVRRLYRQLVDDGHLLLNPCERMPAVHRSKALPRAVLTAAEIQRLLAAPDLSTPVGIRDRAWLEVLYVTAARVGELEGITLRDLDRDQGTVLLRQTKGGVPRVVPLGRHALHWIGAYLEGSRPQLVRHRPAEPALFVVRMGRPLSRLYVREMLRAYSRAAGIRKSVSPHLLRHSCATHLLQAGADIRAIQELLGHRRLSSTMVYTRVVPLEVKEMHERYHPGNRHASR